MTAPCNTCGGRLRFHTTATGQTCEVCDRCGYRGLMRLAVPLPVVITDAEREPERAAGERYGVPRERTCLHCATTYPIRFGRRPKRWCNATCYRAWKRAQTPQTRRRARGAPRGGSQCPKCGGPRIRLAATAHNKHGPWHCQPCRYLYNAAYYADHTPPPTPRHTQQGEAHPHAKLTEAMVREIRATPEIAGKTWAARLGVADSCISKIRRGLTWRRV